MNKRVRLTRNFYLDEFTRSSIAARNNIVQIVCPGSDIFNNLKRQAELIWQPLRNEIKKPIYITSGYRSKRVNRLAKGSPESQHMTGCAGDAHSPYFSSFELASIAVDVCPEFDQIINEFDDWVHASIALPNQTPRNNALTALHVELESSVEVQYFQGIHRGDALRKGLAS